MAKINFKLYAVCVKEYTIEGETWDEVELKAIEDFKKNVYSGIEENECFGREFRVVE